MQCTASKIKRSLLLTSKYDVVQQMMTLHWKILRSLKDRCALTVNILKFFWTSDRTFYFFRFLKCMVTIMRCLAVCQWCWYTKYAKAKEERTIFFGLCNFESPTYSLKISRVRLHVLIITSVCFFLKISFIESLLIFISVWFWVAEMWVLVYVWRLR